MSRRIVIKPNTNREVVEVITAKKRAKKQASLVISVGKNASATYVFAIFAGQNVEQHVTLRLKEGAEAQIIGVVLARGKAEHKITTVMHHQEPHTKGDIVVKAVVKDTAFVSYDGMIKIDKKAQATNSYLDARALMLNRGARCDGKPELEIEADEVKASHSFTSGQIDQEQLFYLRSRGLSFNRARHMIVEGFLTDVLSTVSVTTKERIKQEIGARLG